MKQYLTKSGENTGVAQIRDCFCLKIRSDEATTSRPVTFTVLLSISVEFESIGSVASHFFDEDVVECPEEIAHISEYRVALVCFEVAALDFHDVFQ